MTPPAIPPALVLSSQIGSAVPVSLTAPPNLVSALLAFMATQTIPGPNDPTTGKPTTLHKYPDVGALILSDLVNGLFANVLRGFPSPSMQTAATQLATDQAALQEALMAALPTMPTP